MSANSKIPLTPSFVFYKIEYYHILLTVTQRCSEDHWAQPKPVTCKLESSGLQLGLCIKTTWRIKKILMLSLPAPQLNSIRTSGVGTQALVNFKVPQVIPLKTMELKQLLVGIQEIVEKVGFT